VVIRILQVGMPNDKPFMPQGRFPALCSTGALYFSRLLVSTLIRSAWWRHIRRQGRTGEGHWSLLSAQFAQTLHRRAGNASHEP
jgi:hypothetical protein